MFEAFTANKGMQVEENRQVGGILKVEAKAFKCSRGFKEHLHAVCAKRGMLVALISSLLCAVRVGLHSENEEETHRRSKKLKLHLRVAQEQQFLSASYHYGKYKIYL